MKAKELEQFYTKPEIAKNCFSIIQEIVNINDFKLIEPSAGNGSFSDLFHDNFIAIDLDPKKEYIIKKNFFDLSIKKTDEPIMTIGNPPFGKKSSLAIKFFNKAAEYSDYICMVLPRTFRKDSVINQLNENFSLIQEKILEANSFIFNGHDYDVLCVFQIWKKNNFKRKKIIQKKISYAFDWANKENADFAIRRVGGLSGKLILDFSKYKESSHYYIKSNNNVDIDVLIKSIQNIYKNLNDKAKDTVGNPSLSKHELITILELELKT